MRGPVGGVEAPRQTETESLSQGSKDYIALMVLPGLIPPAVFRMGRKTVRTTVSDAMKTFIDLKPFGWWSTFRQQTRPYPCTLVLGGEERCSQPFTVPKVELEEAWLKEAGLSSLVTDSSSEEAAPLVAGSVTEALLSTLTRQQAATVRRRLDNYTETLKTRNRQPIRDVRDVFAQPDDDSAERCPPPPSHHAESPPSRYHTTTKTIRRDTHRVRPTLPTWSRRADWLLRDSPYSEGVADHKRAGLVGTAFVSMEPTTASLTTADDLSSCDLLRLGFISHIELSTFLLALGVQTKRTRPPRRHTRDGGVFGVPLNSLLENDRKKFPGVKVPVVFQKLLCILEQTGLQTEGILRVPGSAARLKSLRRELDRSCGEFDWSAVRQVDAAGVSSVVHQVQALQLLALLLPEAHRDTLRALLVFLRQVVSHQDRNRMSLWNVSMVMAPNLFTCPRHGNKRSIARQREEMEEAVAGAHLVQLMVTHQDLLWTVPVFLLSQVRQMNQASNQKQFGLTRATRRLLRRKNDRNQVPNISTFI
ncbi:hypothetical protein PFLUV_G00260020 [Perca fluviatilis]|uniref:Rho-GAP domain-containing protein n=1 Tax=Perca fluviatilis TaxID=8168 RepID=A0A6A5E2T5_PERFL|nr:hypothetical protein PFLUV_G00260020 [Perca fluviatilis]